MTTKLSIRTAELPDLIDRMPPKARILSLDCFDTLIWRNTIAPRDVFADLEIAGGGIWMRGRAEARARQQAYFDRKKAEVSIEEIFGALKPNGDPVEVEALVAAELAAEAHHCYGFQPTVDLMRAAKARGLKIIIMSDTYLSEDQLRDLIAAAAGEAVAALIDRVFVSSAFGIGKAEGMFKPVLRALNVGAEAIFHVGDNRVADQVAPAELGIASAHIRQFHGATADRLRQEASAAAMIDGSVRVTAPAYAPHRAAVSLHGSDDPVEALGHDVLGPVMHAFASWVEAERIALSGTLGRPVKPLFLMRDGHLPLQVYRALYGDDKGSAIELSRFTARRASFTDEKAIRRYLCEEGRNGRTDVQARQLGLTAEEAHKFSRGGQVSLAVQEHFTKSALAGPSVRNIVRRSEHFADKLMTHLRANGVEPGDAVMLVDLGYAGSVQNLIEPVLRDRFGMRVAGRYLLLRDHEQTGYDKKGLIDDRHHDLAAIHALCMPIAVVEQLCTVAQGSVVDYGPDGAPIRKAAGQKGLQNAIRDRVQAACIDFACHADDGLVRAPRSDTADCRRRMAAAVLARFLFMPGAEEVGVLQQFDHDVNLGSDDMVKLVDPDQSAEGLRRRGLFYVNQTDRMFLPGELRQHGLPQLIGMFAATRHQLDLRATDFQTDTIRLTAFLADGSGQTILPIEAHATHDGYYQACVPIGAGRFAVGVQIGAVAEWLQIEEAAFHTARGLNEPLAAKLNPAIPAEIVSDGMTAEAPGFYRCAENALLLTPPPAGQFRGDLVLSLVFRPVVRRQPRIALKEAA